MVLLCMHQAFTHDVNVPRICPGSEKIFAKYQGLVMTWWSLHGNAHNTLVYVDSAYTGIPRISWGRQKSTSTSGALRPYAFLPNYDDFRLPRGDGRSSSPVYIVHICAHRGGGGGETRVSSCFFAFLKGFWTG